MVPSCSCCSMTAWRARRFRVDVRVSLYVRIHGYFDGYSVELRSMVLFSQFPVDLRLYCKLTLQVHDSVDLTSPCPCMPSVLFRQAPLQLEHGFVAPKYTPDDKSVTVDVPAGATGTHDATSFPNIFPLKTGFAKRSAMVRRSLGCSGIPRQSSR